MRVFLLLAIAVAATLAAPVDAGDETTLTFRWINSNGGIWEDVNNWLPRGYPRSGQHNAVIDAPGTYTVTHTQFLLAGSVFVNGTGADLVLDRDIGFLIGDEGSIPPPQVLIEGQIVGAQLMVQLIDFTVDDATMADQDVNVTNLSTGEFVTVSLRWETQGFYNGTVPTICALNPADVPVGVLNVAPFDTIQASRMVDGELYYDLTTLMYTDVYQQRLGMEKMTKSLFQRAVEKNLNGLIKMRNRLQFILDNLPDFESNSCCPDESYVYPLQVTEIAKESYIFLRGPEAANEAERICTDVADFSSMMENQLGCGIGPVDIRWTGLGEDNSWQNPKNWWPSRVPDFANANVWLWARDPTFVYMEKDVEINELHVSGAIEIFEGPFSIWTNAVSGGMRQQMRKIWWGSSLSVGSRAWENDARWSPYGAPSADEIAVLAGFGSLETSTEHTVFQLQNIGAKSNAATPEMMTVNGVPPIETDPNSHQPPTKK